MAATGDVCPLAQHFKGSKLKSECYVIIAKCQMSTGANNYDLQYVECMGTIWWGTRGMCPPTFSDGGDII